MQISGKIRKDKGVYRTSGVIPPTPRLQTGRINVGAEFTLPEKKKNGQSKLCPYNLNFDLIAVSSKLPASNVSLCSPDASAGAGLWLK